MQLNIYPKYVVFFYNCCDNNFDKIMKKYNSAQKYYKERLIIYTAIVLGVLLIVGLFDLSILLDSKTKDNNSIWSFPLFLTIFFIPFFLYYLIQYIHYRNATFEHVQKGVIVDCDTIDHGRYGRNVGFYIKFEDEFNQRRVLTKHVHRRPDGHMGQEVLVGQDTKTGEWIILQDID